MTALFFFLFVIAEIIGAFAGNSLSLLGDAAAMSVDVFTVRELIIALFLNVTSFQYLCNWYSEYVKSKNSGRIDDRTKFMLQIAIPLLSISSLLGVTFWIAQSAILIILFPPKKSVVNIYFLYGYASCNAVIDVISAIMFYHRRENVLVQVEGSCSEETTVDTTSQSNRKHESNDLASLKLNINMASALTHVGGDSFRTLAVFLAACTSSITTWNPDVIDAWAALLVSISIIILVSPLIVAVTRELFDFIHPTPTSIRSPASASPSNSNTFDDDTVL